MPHDAIDHEGNWVEVEDDVVRVVKEIERLYPELRVQYAADDGEFTSVAPFRVVERTPTGDKEVLRVWELDDRLLQLLHDADTQKHGVAIIDKLDAQNAKVKAVANSEIRGWAELCADIVMHMSRHQGGTYTFKN